MSVGLAVRASYGPMGAERLICITDNRISFGDFSAEHGALKAEVLLPGWGVLVAGNDVDKADSIIRSSRSKLQRFIQHESRSLEPEDVASVIDESYSEELQIQIENKILRKHGFDGESFRKTGKAKCTPEVYSRVWDKIDRENFSLQFIVYGFDKQARSHIWLVNGEDAPASFDSIGFWSIGSGSNAALSTVAFYLSRDRHLTSFVEKTLYVALAAKFTAESASDVGPSTFAVVLGPPSTFPTVLTQSELKTMRRLWERHGVPRIGNSLSIAVKELLEQSEKEMASRANPSRNTERRDPTQSTAHKSEPEQ